MLKTIIWLMQYVIICSFFALLFLGVIAVTDIPDKYIASQKPKAWQEGCRIDYEPWRLLDRLDASIFFLYDLDLPKKIHKNPDKQVFQDMMIIGSKVLTPVF